MNLSSWYFLALICLFLPYMSIAGHRRLVKTDHSLPSKTRLRVRTVLILWILGALGFAVANLDHLHLLPTWEPHLAEVLLGLGILVAFYGLRAILRTWLAKTGNRFGGLLLPSKVKELPLWFLVSLSAGIIEEYVYRGVTYDLLLYRFDYPALAITIASLTFGLSHYAQGVRAVAFIAVLAVGMHLLVNYSGSLYTAMAVHVIYDLAAGIQNVMESRSASSSDLTSEP